MQTSILYKQNLELMRKGVRRIVNQGGQYSGKTVNILGVLGTLSAEDTEPTVTTVTSMSFPHLKGGALRDFEMYVYPSFKSAISGYHKTDHLFTFKSGSIIEFKVFESEMDARGPKRDRLFINEANKFEWLKYFHLDGRSNQTIIDYNPSVRFWSHDKVIDQPGNRTIISDHRHNPFLAEEKHREIEDICTFLYNPDGTIAKNEKGAPIVLKGDYELWKVYARGITGNVTGVIFPDWQMIDDSDFPYDEDFIFSIDFGYTNDPTAIVKQCKIGNTLFVKELAYETGIPPKQIRQILIANGYKETEPLYCEHDPDMIKALRNLGIQAMPARKGQGSINAGIELLKTYDVKYPNSSRNLHRDRGMYVWSTEKDTGRLTNIPIDMYNHCFDATRYGAYTRYLRQAA